MHKKPGIFQKAEKALTGKGFYMVLLLCLVILGASGYLLYRTVSGIGADASQSASAPAEVTVTAPAQSEEEPQSDLTAGGEEASSADLEDAKETASEAEAQPALEPSAEEAVPVTTPAEEEAVPVTAPAEEEAVPAEAEAESEAEPVAAPSEQVQAETAPASLSWPIQGEVVAAFSNSELTYNEAMGDWRTHNGMDISAALGAEVLAAADGTVASVTTDPVTGTTLTLSHSGGMTTVYGNLDPDTVSAAVGDAVTAGQALACVGSSASGEGSGESAFLHFAVTVDGQNVDPQQYLS